MAGNKVNKAKGKYDKSKGTSINPNNDEIEDYDLSLLRKPIQTSITGLGQARKIFDLATEEVSNNHVELAFVMHQPVNCVIIVCFSLF